MVSERGKAKPRSTEGTTSFGAQVLLGASRTLRNVQSIAVNPFWLALSEVLIHKESSRQTERFFSRVLHPHLLGVCCRDSFVLRSSCVHPKQDLDSFGIVWISVGLGLISQRLNYAKTIVASRLSSYRSPFLGRSLRLRGKRAGQ